MIKKFILLVIVGIITTLGLIYLYFRHYQNVPEFSMPLMSEAALPTAGQKIIIFSPHPDDETIALGGYIAKSIKNGAEVKIVFLTNGDGHRFALIEEAKKIYPNSKDYIQSGINRQEEAKKALKILGIKEENMIFLGYPDDGLKEILDHHWQSLFRSPFTKKDFSPYSNSYRLGVNYTGENLYNDILSILNTNKPNIIIAPHPKDTNKDHEASFEFIQKALENYNLSNDQKPGVFYYLVHYRHFPSPKGLHIARLLTPPINLAESGRWYKISLEQDIENLKEQAVSQYESQLEVPMLRGLMEGFIKKNELLYKK